MLTAPASKRRGVTLVEVLTAIFIMAIGLMALLTLFPLGALTMAQAIKDDRCAICARNAESQMRAYWQYAVNNNKKSPDANLLVGMRNPQGAADARDRSTNTGPSYPVYLDGVGVLRYGNGSPVAWRDWLAGTPNTVNRRVPAVFTSNWLVTNYPQFQEPLITNFFMNGDDTTFNEDGLPPTSSIVRQRRYTWAYMLRLPNCTRAQEVEMMVIVYANRPVGMTEDLVPQGEAAFGATFNAGETTATLTWGAATDPPVLRRGGWLLDATMPTAANPTFTPRGHFYRVVNVGEPIQDMLGNYTLSVELETAIKANAAGASSIAVVLEDVIEVFDKGLVAEGN